MATGAWNIDYTTNASAASVSAVYAVPIETYPVHVPSQKLIQPIIMIVRLVVRFPLLFILLDLRQQSPDLGIRGELVLMFG